MKILCKIFGHKWERGTTTITDEWVQYSSFCERCREIALRKVFKQDLVKVTPYWGIKR